VSASRHLQSASGFNSLYQVK